MEAPGSGKDERDRIWTIAIAIMLVAVFVSTMVYLVFFTTVPQNYFVVGDEVYYDVTGSEETNFTIEVVAANGSEFSVACVEGAGTIWADRTLFWYNADNATLDATYVDTVTKDTDIGTRPLKHYHKVLEDGAVEDVYMGKDNGVVYQLEYTKGDYSIMVEITGSSVGWL